MQFRQSTLSWHSRFWTLKTTTGIPVSAFALLCIVASSISLANAASTGANVSVAIVNQNIVEVIGHNFSSSKSVTVQIVAGTTRYPVVTMAQADGRFSATKILAEGVSGKVTVTATQGVLKASAAVNVGGTVTAVGAVPIARSTGTPAKTSTAAKTSTGGGTITAASSGTASSAAEGVTAAKTLNWGTPVDNWNFDSMSGWSAYNSPNDQFGNRQPSQVKVSSGIATITGTSDGKTGAMAAYKSGHDKGRWEVREKIGGSASCWRPVLLLWPDAENWPKGGEVDYAENGGGDLGGVNFFLHYGSDNSQEHGEGKVDMSQWHNYAVEWTDKHIAGYIDGKQFFEDTNKSHFPPGAMHPTAQLDGKQGCDGNTTQQIDWYRYYAP